MGKEGCYDILLVITNFTTMTGKFKLLFLYLKKKKENFPEVIKNVPHFY